MTAGEIMDRSAALLNDTQKSIYTYVAQIPYLNTAVDELLESMEQNNIPITNETSTAMILSAGDTTIAFNGGPPVLPKDLIEIQQLWERANGTNDNWSRMIRKEFLPPFEQETAYLQFFSWKGQKLQFLPSTSDIQLRLDYIARVQPVIEDENTQVNIINAKSFLAYRNAALCAVYIGENGTRADRLNMDAGFSLDRFIGIPVKGRQAINKRRRPFMSSYRNRGYM